LVTPDLNTQPGASVSLIGRHLFLVMGVVAAIVARGFYLGAPGRVIFAMALAQGIAGITMMYIVPLLVLGVSALFVARISWLAFFRITAACWLVILLSLWGINWPSW
jgi:hypothetical protein